MKKNILITIIKIAIHILLQIYLPEELRMIIRAVKYLLSIIAPLLPLPVRVHLVIFLLAFEIRFPTLFRLISFLYRII